QRPTVGRAAQRPDRQRAADLVPLLAPGDRLETRQWRERSAGAELVSEPQHPGADRAGEHHVVDGHETGEIEVTGRKGAPLAVVAVLPDLVVVDDRDPGAVGTRAQRCDPMAL